ncbi:hypothetical protein [Candidatus Kryptobacter tengchongensis]|nr:hypothetical protein [Candidatus Kryptobacter tengchongensis]
MRSKHNELGQFPTGCVPRDTVYAKIFKEMKNSQNLKVSPNFLRKNISL